MVKIKIIAIGKDKDTWVSDGCAHFVKLLGRWAKVEFVVVPSLKNTASLSPTLIKQKEAERLLPAITTGHVVALCDSGRKMDTSAFSKWLEGTASKSGGTITFIIGGAYGLDDRVLDKADEVLSLSSLTFSHQLVRLVLLEQLYRALSILQGTDYHK
ncbi:MAG: 23S rRNA (pseudouridine(1915)-N(3))-methyltransferase RlmH [Candidatus Zixiibacteriota bacterium]